jgi:hypothetical protein
VESGRSQSIVYVSRAVLHGRASPARTAALVDALERVGARVRVDLEHRYLRFALPCDRERWIVLGRLAELLDGFADIATWDPVFEERWTPHPPPFVADEVA